MGAKLELKELKARSLLLGACTSCPIQKSDLEACSIEIKELKQILDHSSCYKFFSPPCEVCGTLKGKLLHATKEKSELKQEVAYLSARLERTKLNEKIIKDDLSRVEESEANPHTNWALALREVRTRVRRVLPSLFLAPTTTKRRKHSNPQKLTTHLIQSHLSTPRER
jgi:hypothetical protein